MHYCSLFLCYHSIVIWLLFRSSCCWLDPFLLLINSFCITDWIFYIVDKFFLYWCSFLLHCYLAFLVLFSCYLALLVVISSSCCVVQFFLLLFSSSSYYLVVFIVLVGSFYCVGLIPLVVGQLFLLMLVDYSCCWCYWLVFFVLPFGSFYY